jgi:hypothetical protein
MLETRVSPQRYSAYDPTTNVRLCDGYELACNLVEGCVIRSDIPAPIQYEVGADYAATRDAGNYSDFSKVTKLPKRGHNSEMKQRSSETTPR